MLAFICIISSFICVFSFLLWLPMILKDQFDNFNIFAASVILPNGKIDRKNENNAVGEIVATDIINFGNPQTSSEKSKSDENIEAILQNIPPFELSHGDNEVKYGITECLFGASGSKYQNIFINNKTSLDLNVEEILNQKPDISIKNKAEPQVLVIHTHTSEAYMDKDQGFYYQSFCARTTDPRYNVVQVGNAICQSLEQNGIKTVHDTSQHDTPSFSGSYKRSAETIDKNLQKYPSISVVLDIHRDTIENKEKLKIKPTFSINGRKAAQIMIIAGCDTDGTLAYPDWQYNLRLALRLHKRAETMYPGMTRSFLFKHARYNLHKTHGSMLIEVGSDANTLNEAVLSGAMLGNALASVLNELA